MSVDVKYNLLFAIFAIILVASFASANEITTVKIHYLSGCEITLSGINADTNVTDNSVTKPTDDKGDVTFSLSTSVSTFRLSADFKRTGTLIKTKDFGNSTFTAGGIIELNAIDSGESNSVVSAPPATITANAIANTSSSNSTAAVNATNNSANITARNITALPENTNEDTGFSLSWPSIPVYVYYIIGGVIFIIIMIIAGRKLH